MFPISRPTGQNLRRLQLFLRSEKKSATDPVQRFRFLSKVKTISLREFVRADFRIFSVFNIHIKNNNMATVLTRPSTLVAIYFDKCSHIPASNVIKAVRHSFKCNKSRAAQCPFIPVIGRRPSSV